MESEIGFQLHDLPSGELPKQENNGLFVGSGDSYAACLLAQLASGNKVLSCHPLDLVRDPSIADGRVSMSFQFRERHAQIFLRQELQGKEELIPSPSRQNRTVPLSRIAIK